MVAISGVTRQMRGAVLVVLLARPPVNALNAALMADITRALKEAEDDPAVSAVVLGSEGAQFSAGLDVSELGVVRGAALPGLCGVVESLSKPVVAAIAGNALGGATELVLACHARVAHAGARLGLPEISLGLLPVGGTTQRLPRLVGASVALKLLLDGVPMSAVEALAVGLLDAVVEEAPLARALALAETLAGNPPRKTADRRDGMRDPVAFQAAVAEARKRIDGWRLPAPQAAVDCVEAAMLLPFDMGLRFEEAQAETMADSAEALALRHAFLAEKRALVPPKAVTSVAVAKISEIAILGTDGAAAEVARQALAAGLKVQVLAEDRAGLADALQRIAARQEAMVAEGLLAPAAREADWLRLTGALATESIGDADLVLVTPRGPRIADLTTPVVALGGNGALVLHAGSAPGVLATLSVTMGVPFTLQAVALGFARRLGWRVMMQGPGLPMDQRLRHVLSRAIAHLEAQGFDRQDIAAALASVGLGAGGRVKLPPAPDTADTVLGVCMPALMNEAARMVSESVPRRASDVDAAAILSGLFPRWQGGPLYQADRMGVMVLRAKLRAMAETAPQLFTPAPILDRLIAGGRSFADHDAS